MLKSRRVAAPSSGKNLRRFAENRTKTALNPSPLATKSRNSRNNLLNFAGGRILHYQEDNLVKLPAHCDLLTWFGLIWFDWQNIKWKPLNWSIIFDEIFYLLLKTAVKSPAQHWFESRKERNFNATHWEILSETVQKLYRMLAVASCFLYFLTAEQIHLSDFAKVFQKDCWR